MASSQSHIEQWKHNRRLLELIPLEYPDWLVTVSFYVALHAVDALFAHEKITHITSHEQRNETLLRTHRYSGINSKYQPIYSLCRTVRYLADPKKWVPADQIEKQVIGRYLYPIEQSVQNLLGQNLSLPKIAIAKAGSPIPAAVTTAAAGAIPSP